MHFKASYPILASVQNKAITADSGNAVKKEKSIVYKDSFNNHLLLTVQNNKKSAMTINSGAGFKFDFKNFLTENEVQNIKYTDADGWHKTQEGTTLIFTYQGAGGQSLPWNQGSSFTFEVSNVSCSHSQDAAKKLIVESNKIPGAYCQPPMIHFLDPPTHPNNLQIRCDFENRTAIQPVAGKIYAPPGLKNDVIYFSPDASSKIFNSLNFFIANEGSLAINKGHIKIWFDSAGLQAITDSMPVEQKEQLEAQNAMEKAACIASNKTIFDNYSLEIKEAYGNQFKPIEKKQVDPTSWVLNPKTGTLLPGNSGTKDNYNRIELQFQDVVSFLGEGLTNLYISFEKMDNYNSAIFIIPLEKKKPEAQIIDFNALNSSLVLDPGEKAQLKWDTFLVDRVMLDYVDGTGSRKELDSANQSSLSPNEQAFTLPDAFQQNETTQVTLYAYQKAGDSNPVAQKSLSFQVTKAKPQILSFTGEPTSDDKMLLKWSTQNADNCYLDSDPCSTSGSKTLNLTKENTAKTYQLKATSSVGATTRTIQFTMDPKPVKSINFGAKLFSFSADGKKLLVVRNDSNSTTYEIPMDQLGDLQDGDITQGLSRFGPWGNSEINAQIQQQQFQVTVGPPNNELKALDYLKVSSTSYDGSTQKLDWYYYFYNQCSFCVMGSSSQILSFPNNLQPNGNTKMVYASPPSKEGFAVFDNGSKKLYTVVMSGTEGVGYQPYATQKSISELSKVQVDSMAILPLMNIFCSYSNKHHYYYLDGQILPFSGPTNGPSPVAAWGYAGNAALLFQAEKSGNNWNLDIYNLDAGKKTKTKRQSFPLPTDNSNQIPILAVSPNGGILLVSMGSKVYLFTWKDTLGEG